jgi:protein-disulfide isomerase
MKSALGWLIFSAVVLLGAALLFFAKAGPSASFKLDSARTGISKKEVAAILRQYLLDHPEIVAEAMQRLEGRERAAEAAAAKSVLASHADELLHDAASPVGGNAEGDVTLIEFFDYNCPYCRQVAPLMVKAEAADPQLRFVYKEFPILAASSTFAAKAALAAHRQGKYVPFHAVLMESQGTLLARLKADMTDPAIQAAIDRNLALARALHINGTPGFVIGEQIVSGAVDLATMEGLIRVAREKK